VFIDGLRSKIENNQKIRLLDFGAGKCRFGNMLAEYATILEYHAFFADADSFSNLLLDELVKDKWAEGWNYGENSEIIPSNYFDAVLLVNTLHEIPLDLWESTFNTISKVLKEDGYLFFCEAKVLSTGEHPKDNPAYYGYLMLGKDELDHLFWADTIAKESDKIVSIELPKKYISVDNALIKSTISLLRDNSLKKTIEETLNQRNPRKRAFYSIQHTNAVMALNYFDEVIDIDMHSNNEFNGNKTANSKKTLNIGYLPILEHLILGITKYNYDNNIETSRYLELNLQKKVSWDEMRDGLSSRELDIAFMFTPDAMNLFYSEKNIKMLLWGYHDSSIFVANKRSNITHLKDFNGKTILIPNNASMYSILLHEFLQKEGMSVGHFGKDVTIEVIAPEHMPLFINNSLSGNIAGCIVAEPFRTQIINQGIGYISCVTKDIIPSHLSYALVARNGIVKNHSESLQELVTSLILNAQFIMDDINKTTKIATDFLNQPEDIIKIILENFNQQLSMSSLLPSINELEYMQNYLIDTVAFPILLGRIDVSQFVDLRFAQVAELVMNENNRL